jgi:hypothetical protein
MVQGQPKEKPKTLLKNKLKQKRAGDVARVGVDQAQGQIEPRATHSTKDATNCILHSVYTGFDESKVKIS